MSDPGIVSKDNSPIDTAMSSDPVNHKTLAISKFQLDEVVAKSDEFNL
jgi:hypothetical protein